MKVALVIERFGPGGGVEGAALAVARELAGRGEHVTAVCHRVFGTPPAGVGVRRLRVPRFWQPLRLARFSRAAREATASGFDVVHSFARTRSQHIFRAGGGSHATYLENTYRWPGLARLAPRHQAILRLEEAVFRDASQWIQCNARGVADDLATRYGVAAERLVTLYNGVDLAAFHPAHRDTLGAALRRELGLAGSVALFVGSGFARKGLDRAIAGLADAGVDAALLVAGHGDPAPFRAQARARGVEDRVRFLGERADVPALCAAADLFVLPTRYDPFANACLEALAAGLPVATTRTNGASELVEPGANGWLGDDFRSAFELLGDRAGLARMGAAARRTAEAFDWARHVDRLLELYARVRA
jgi:UDP-glucose:(heptosyl)LPS alpha-1,3-glucosyltransferase